MHGMPAFRLSEGIWWRKVVVLAYWRTTMNTDTRFEFLDNTLFLILLFVPVNLLLAGAMALATASAQ
jgi:hypothetical protein